MAPEGLTIKEKNFVREDVCQVSSQNINSKCLKFGMQTHPKGPLLGMPEVNIFSLSKMNSTKEIRGPQVAKLGSKFGSKEAI